MGLKQRFSADLPPELYEFLTNYAQKKNISRNEALSLAVSALQEKVEGAADRRKG